MSWCACYVKGQSLRCSLGCGNAGQCAVTLYVGGGAKKEQWCLLHSLPDFGHSLCYPQSNWAPLVLIPKWAGYLLAPFVPQSSSLWVRPHCHKSSPPRMSVSAPPTGLDECFFFISLVVGFPCGSIFCQFWLLFVFIFVVVLLLVVQGGTVCLLPMPPSWLEAPCFLIFKMGKITVSLDVGSLEGYMS